MNDEELDRHARAIAAQLEEEHPDLETELFVYAEGGLGEEHRAEIAEHLRDCRRCREDVDDVRAFAPDRPRPRRRVWMPLVATAAAAAVIALFVVTRDAAPPPPATATAVHRPAPTPAPAPPPSRYARAEWETLVRDARAGAPLELPDLSPLRGPNYVLRGTTSRDAELMPAGVVIETTRPELRWPAPRGARSIVTIFDGDTEVARSGELRGNRWTPERELRRGVTYTWQVELRIGDDIAIVPAPPSPPARFRILDGAAAVELDHARRTNADPLLLGILYAKAGLAAEAREALVRVTAVEDAAAARRLLERLPQ
jgi:Putative zinc-finger